MRFKKNNIPATVAESNKMNPDPRMAIGAHIIHKSPLAHHLKKNQAVVRK